MLTISRCGIGSRAEDDPTSFELLAAELRASRSAMLRRLGLLEKSGLVASTAVGRIVASGAARQDFA
jgi:biotin operon repressor